MEARDDADYWQCSVCDGFGHPGNPHCEWCPATVAQQIPVPSFFSFQLQLCDQLPEPIFTPSTKATEGHDENISYEAACNLVGTELMNQIRDLSMGIYEKGAGYALERGIIIADTKFEFGLGVDGELVLIDEVLTPDSSRFWPADDWQPGREQESFDKQFVRNYTETLVASGEWNKEYPGPVLPDDIIENTIKRYEEALRRLTD